jgi:hypothetical protein
VSAATVFRQSALEVPVMPLPPEQERIEAIGDQLRAKISSKFTASTFLAGFSLTVLTGQVFALCQDVERLPLLFAPAVGAVFGAFLIFVEAIARLDELTMPKRFWTEDPNAVRPQPELSGSYLTDDDLWELQKRMIFLWQRLAIVATIITAVAVMAMLCPWNRVTINSARLWTMMFAVIGVLGAGGYILWARSAACKRFGRLVRPVD